MRSKLVLPILLLSILFLACTNPPKEAPAEDPGLVLITKPQFDSEKMELGIPSLTAFSELVHFTGTIIPSPNGWAQISLPIPGIISKIHCRPGQMVSKGDPLFEVGGNELIDMQRDFAESSAALARLRSEYERMKELSNEKIGSRKEFILAESYYLAEKAKYNALKIKLEIIGLDVIKIEGDVFYNSYSLRSPIHRSVTQIHATIGQYTESMQNIAEIIDTRSLILKLTVFEKEIGKVKQDQIARFSLAGEQEVTFGSKLITAGKTIHKESKSIDCYANIENLQEHNFVINQFAEGDIIVSSDSVLAVPESAIVNSANRNFVLMLKKEEGTQYLFDKVEVVKGRTSNNMVELKGKMPIGKMLLKGAYNIHLD
jgi:cobalt-zinc-cadmium efflux system membrane fusion protein